MKKKVYVLGFLFNTRGEVALIRKLRPEWQAGKLNGIGGKVERGEGPLKAMVREFREETGATVSVWQPCATLRVNENDAVVYVFAARGDYGLKTTTDELVGWYKEGMQYHGIMRNLHWLIPFCDECLDKGGAAEIEFEKL